MAIGTINTIVNFALFIRIIVCATDREKNHETHNKKKNVFQNGINFNKNSEKIALYKKSPKVINFQGVETKI